MAGGLFARITPSDLSRERRAVLSLHAYADEELAQNLDRYQARSAWLLQPSEALAVLAERQPSPPADDASGQAAPVEPVTEGAPRRDRRDDRDDARAAGPPPPVPLVSIVNALFAYFSKRVLNGDSPPASPDLEKAALFSILKPSPMAIDIDTFHRRMLDISAPSRADDLPGGGGGPSGGELNINDARWLRLLGDRQGQPTLHDDLQPYQSLSCTGKIESYQVAGEGEMYAEVSSGFEADSTGWSMNDIAKALIPHSWPECNDFFCSMTRVRRLDGSAAPTTGGELEPTVEYWRGVYRECVGACPGGDWFPNTFLVFTWYREGDELILLYQLLPPSRLEPCVLRIDQGYVRAVIADGKLRVTALKQLAIADDDGRPGGQTLAQWACELGWQDIVFNMLSTCGRRVTTGKAPRERPRSGPDAPIQLVLDDCEVHARQAAKDAAKRLDDAMAAMRAGTYRSDNLSKDFGSAVAQMVRDGSRAINGWARLGRATFESLGAIGTRKQGSD